MVAPQLTIWLSIERPESLKPIPPASKHWKSSRFITLRGGTKLIPILIFTGCSRSKLLQSLRCGSTYYEHGSTSFGNQMLHRKMDTIYWKPISQEQTLDEPNLRPKYPKPALVINTSLHTHLDTKQCHHVNRQKAKEASIEIGTEYFPIALRQTKKEKKTKRVQFCEGTIVYRGLFSVSF